jgi:predicted RNA binding protein YcfA (HicA-like mRNA interferase family)
VKLPRDWSGRDVAHALGRLGYTITRQTGSHVRLTTQRGGEHHVTIPDHPSLRAGTLASILREVGAHHGIERDELLRQLLDG